MTTTIIQESTMQPDKPQEIADRVLRRAEVGKIARVLQSSLALANVKIKHGWENMSVDTLTPRLNEQLARKRTASSDMLSETSSTISGDTSSARGLASSPLTLPMFSDDLTRSGDRSAAKRRRIGGGKISEYPMSASRTGRRSRNSATVNSWKRSHHLPQSSPLTSGRHAHFASATTTIPRLSFISEASSVTRTVSPELSEDDDADLPLHSFALQQSMIHSSPPRTPPPQRRLLNKESNVSWSRTPRDGEEGADLLMYLATSPTPNNGSRGFMHAPSTPPTRSTPLPSSMMNTPGGSNLFNYPNTPGNNFNFSDFCNITPSPAQSQWPRTPALARTPLAVSSARRRLNFDNLVPSNGSPGLPRHRRDAGIGMELGGELRS